PHSFPTRRSSDLGATASRIGARAVCRVHRHYSQNNLLIRILFMPFKVLIVDDEPDLEVLIRQRFRKRIKDGEFEFVFAHDGQEALNKLKEDPALDVVMSDINMPVMD